MEHIGSIKAGIELDLEQRIGIRDPKETNVDRQIKRLHLDEAFKKGPAGKTKRTIQADMMKRAGVRTGDLESIKESHKGPATKKTGAQLMREFEVDLGERAGVTTVEEAASARESAGIQAEAEADIKENKDWKPEGSSDKGSEKKQLLEALTAKGITHADLEECLGHAIGPGLELVSPTDIADLRARYSISKL